MTESIGRKDVDFNASQELITNTAIAKATQWKLIDSWILETLPLQKTNGRKHGRLIRTGRRATRTSPLPKIRRGKSTNRYCARSLQRWQPTRWYRMPIWTQWASWDVSKAAHLSPCRPLILKRKSDCRYSPRSNFTFATQTKRGPQSLTVYAARKSAGLSSALRRQTGTSCCTASLTLNRLSHSPSSENGLFRPSLGKYHRGKGTVDGDTECGYSVASHPDLP